MINPFIICSDEELTALRAYADRRSWELQCQALGASLDIVRAYEHAAWRYAATTPYPNGNVVAYLRRLAREALAHGDSIPESAEKAIEDDNRRRLARSIARIQ